MGMMKGGKMVELRPCPFCGGFALCALGRGYKAIVFCGNGCNVEMSAEIKNANQHGEIPYNALEEAFLTAANLWNTRV